MAHAMNFFRPEDFPHDQMGHIYAVQVNAAECANKKLETQNMIVNEDRTRALEHKIKCLEIHRDNLEKRLQDLKIEHEREIEYLKLEHKKNFWRKFLPPKIKINFGEDE